MGNKLLPECTSLPSDGEGKMEKLTEATYYYFYFYVGIISGDARREVGR